MTKVQKIENVELKLRECRKAVFTIGDELLTYMMDMAILRAKRLAVASLQESPQLNENRLVAAE